MRSKVMLGPHIPAYLFLAAGAAALDGHRSTLITTTLLLVLFSTMVLGGLTKPLLDHIQGPAGEGHAHRIRTTPLCRCCTAWHAPGLLGRSTCSACMAHSHSTGGSLSNQFCAVENQHELLVLTSWN